MQSVAQIVVDADSVVQLGKTFRLRYQYSYTDSTEKILSPNWEWEKDHPNYEVLMGPSRSTRTSYQMTNGGMTATYGETFTFLLTFSQEGRYTMPMMKAETRSGEKLTSELFTVRATKEAVASTPRISSSEKSSKNDLLVVEASVNKSRLSLGDSAECEIRLYTNLNVSQVAPLSTLEICPAYWREHQLPKEKSFETVAYRSDSVRSVLLGKYSLIPLQAGEMILEPMRFKATRQYYHRDADPFEAFFHGGNWYIAVDTVIETTPIRIQVEDRKIPASDFVLDGQASHDVGLVIDRSLSLNMRSDSLAPSFMQLENMFVEQMEKGKVVKDYSVTLFAKRPHFPKSSKWSDLLSMSPSEDNDGSAIYDAILASALRDGALTSERPAYSILLLTDGFDNSSRLSEKTLVNILLQHHIRVDVVAFASRNDSVFCFVNDTIGGVSMKNSQNFGDVERIARQTSGEFFLVDSKEQLSAAIRKIRESRMKAEVPRQQPDRHFLPDRSLMVGLYNELMRSAGGGF